MLQDRPKTRLYVEEPLAADGRVELDGARAHFLRHVLRLDRGAALALFNGRDGEWRGTIDEVGKTRCSVRVGNQLRGFRASTDLWLCFAPIKRARIDLIAEKATELGVAALRPVLTRHSDVARVNTERLRAHAVEASEQCERLDVPAVSEPASLPELVENWPPDRQLILCAETGEATPIATAVAALPPGPAAILTGPEGGFAQSELDLLRKLPFVVAVGLGPRILRAETAAIAALACYQALAGDWKEADRPLFDTPP